MAIASDTLSAAREVATKADLAELKWVIGILTAVTLALLIFALCCLCFALGIGTGWKQPIGDCRI